MERNASLCALASLGFQAQRTSTSIEVRQNRIMEIDDLTYSINAAVFEVNRELGPGFLEKVYENALLLELSNKGLKARSQAPIKIKYKGTEVGDYYADILVEDQVIVEVKAIESLQKIHEAQLLNYLKATGCKVGLLVNFTYPKAQIKRFVL